MRKKDKD
jgi:hypothetical protein